jgi:outer membrane protein OmpA-like peptidoglycan-associated protein
MRIEQTSSLVIKTIVASLALLTGNGCRRDRDRTEGPGTANQRPVEPSSSETSPNAQQPNAQQPSAQPPGGQQPNAQEPNAQQPNAQEPNAQQPNAQEPNAQQSNAQQQDQDLATTTITVIDIDPKLATMCAISPANTSFKFDSASPSATAKQHLDMIAECVTAGAAKGKEVRVVGHRDTTGTDRHNAQMGKSRAEAVSEYLRTKGVQSQRVETEKGEFPQPTTMPGWTAARRVTIRLEK